MGGTKSKNVPIAAPSKVEEVPSRKANDSSQVTTGVRMFQNPITKLNENQPKRALEIERQAVTVQKQVEMQRQLEEAQRRAAELERQQQQEFQRRATEIVRQKREKEEEAKRREEKRQTLLALAIAQRKAAAEEEHRKQIENAERIATEYKRLKRLEKAKQAAVAVAAEEARQKQLLNEERVRIELRERAKCEKELLEAIDLCIRTQDNFDDRQPQKNKIPFGKIKKSSNVKNAIENMKAFQSDITLKSFLSSRADDFTVCPDWKSVSLKHLTPFQGAETHRVFGYFHCHKCRRQWSSAASWKDKWQKCQKCESKIYPYQQHVLERREDEDYEDSDRVTRPHDSSRCQKCVELGGICLPHSYHDVSGYFD